MLFRSWGVYGPPFPPGTAQASRIFYTSRAFPLYTAGNMRSFSYDPAGRNFELQGESAPVERRSSKATVLFVPRALGAPISATGARLRTLVRSDGSRLVYAWPLGGPYRVFTAGG